MSYKFIPVFTLRDQVSTTPFILRNFYRQQLLG